MHDSGEPIELRSLTLPPIDRVRESDNDFLQDLVNAGNELCYTLAVCAAQVLTPKLEPRHQAVLMGVMSRLYKLYDTFQMLTCEQRMEMSMIIGRSTTDTAIDVIYLSGRREAELLDEFIRTSLATDKEIYELMLNDEADGRGDPIIRDRIKSSIESVFNDAGMTLDEIDSRKWKRKHSTRKRSKLCGIENLYLLIYKNLSRVTHSSWSEIVKYHLERDGLSWSPNLNHAIPSPQLVGSPPILVAKAGIEYTESLTENTTLIGRFRELIDWFVAMAHKHEAFLRE